MSFRNFLNSHAFLGNNSKKLKHMIYVIQLYQKMSVRQSTVIRKRKGLGDWYGIALQ